MELLAGARVERRAGELGVGARDLGHGLYAAGELVGFAVPALAGALAEALGLAQGVMVIVLVCAGSLEGAVLGLAQSLVLRRYLPSMRCRDWMVATALAAA